MKTLQEVRKRDMLLHLKGIRSNNMRIKKWIEGRYPNYQFNVFVSFDPRPLFSYRRYGLYKD